MTLWLPLPPKVSASSPSSSTALTELQFLPRNIISSRKWECQQIGLVETIIYLLKKAPDPRDSTNDLAEKLAEFEEGTEAGIEEPPTPLLNPAAPSLKVFFLVQNLRADLVVEASEPDTYLLKAAIVQALT